MITRYIVARIFFHKIFHKDLCIFIIQLIIKYISCQKYKIRFFFIYSLYK